MDQKNATHKSHEAQMQENMHKIKTKKSFYIQTFGCQMNVADSDRMGALLGEGGMEPAAQLEEADVIIINGCSVREKAVHKAVSALGRVRQYKEKGALYPIIGVGGCVAQLEKKTLFERAPYLDFVFGPDAIDELPELIFRTEHGDRHQIFTDFDREMKYSTETKVYGAKTMAYVNIMKGCDKYCTYCIVPFTRGKEKSRKIQEVLADLANLVSQGIQEVTLLGQNVNSFGKGNPNTENYEPRELSNIIGKVGPKEGDENFPQLLRAIDRDERLVGLKRIRFTSSHPLDFSDELIDCYQPPEKGGVSKLAGQLHLPVQSGSNRVLQKMARHHKIENYIDQMKRLKEMRPDIGLSTDMIVGFPTETEEDFQDTLRLLDELQYDQVYAFAYSPRPGTRAAKLEDDVPDAVKKDRLNRLLDHQLVISEKRNLLKIGQETEILVEAESKNQKMNTTRSPLYQFDRAASETPKKVWTGRTSCGRLVHFSVGHPRSYIGKLVKVKINHATPLALYGEVAEDPRAPFYAEELAVVQ